MKSKICFPYALEFGVFNAASKLILICCFSDKENLCLYGHLNKAWEVALPTEEAPPELRESALGINFARDGMNRKDWLSLVVVNSDFSLLCLSTLGLDLIVIRVKFKPQYLYKLRISRGRVNAMVSSTSLIISKLFIYQSDDESDHLVLHPLDVEDAAEDSISSSWKSQGLALLQVEWSCSLTAFVGKAPLKVMVYRGVCGKSTAKGHVL
ncbi:hypothetical protein J1N35_025833 [Gossypium stocksii]|uniref:PHD finger protein ALFIN-LIKE n=1 Tax=Gossypium stocksii TaxID=47602 RepID=A0A9D3V7Q4_9ROSI|nr:hypothetical protein J1N35_025833 [Gossypium stocksii]